MIDLDRLEELHDDAADEISSGCAYWEELGDDSRSHMVEFARLILAHAEELQK